MGPVIPKIPKTRMKSHRIKSNHVKTEEKLHNAQFYTEFGKFDMNTYA